ncbi:MAG TPA: family 43 glycosylhydrolase [Sphingobium sp.]|uniref:family 43 glycosylhydrolase n=1 Tax=Sphingobium sp. TaxID=1912891 RepID=UPI002ED0D83C
MLYRLSFFTAATVLIGTTFAVASAKDASIDRRFSTYVNPIDLPYRYQSASRAPYREAADPTIVRFKDRYWLFPSHSQGYWWSTDLLHWNFVLGKGYDVGLFAPTVVEMHGRLYLSVSQRARKIWTTDDPATGLWTVAAEINPGVDDPALLFDDDGRLYMYEGISPKDPLHVHELDPKTFQRLRSADIPQSRDTANRGWEVVGDNNENQIKPPYIEGAWITKHDGRYYLQYAGPGTQYKTYADGLLVADRPMGPFTYQSYSPISIKPSGFITGAGHGSIFKDAHDEWWGTSTMTISVRHPFERRLGLYPASFSRTGQLSINTYLGDYPRYIDGDRGLTGWMLLSRKKMVEASSVLDGFEAPKAVDEDVRSWWSAKTGEPGEWYQVDLGGIKTVQAVQINFADQDATARGISEDVYKYALELSDDGHAWRMAIDRTVDGRDGPHDYEVLPKPARARFVRLRNVHMPDGAKFSLYDLRVFGNGEGRRPDPVSRLKAQRDPTDGRKLHMEWRAAEGAEFYIIRLGSRRGPLNQNYQVYDGTTSLDVASLNIGTGYCFIIDSVNENGITSIKTKQCVW